MVRIYHILSAAFLIVLFIILATLPDASVTHQVITCSEDLGILLQEDDEGLSVIAVQDNSIANQSGIEPGDTLLALNETPLVSLDKLDKLLQANNEKGHDRILSFDVLHNGSYAVINMTDYLISH